MISMNEAGVAALIILGFIIMMATYWMGYDKGYDNGKEYQRKEIEDILKTFKGE